MKYLWRKLGNLLYFLSLPLLALYVNGSHRSRVIIFSGTKVVVTCDWLGDGKWGLPGGGIKAGESKFEGAAREVKEETSLDLDPAKLKFIHELGIKDGFVKIKLSIFETELASQLPINRPRPLEIIDAKWIEIKDLSQKNAKADLLVALATHQTNKHHK